MKKKILLMIIITLIMLYAPSVLAVQVTGCSKAIPGVYLDSKITDIVHTIIVIIQIAVPVVLVIFGMLDLFKGITAQKEDEIKKGQQILIKRIVTAVIVFFVIAVVRLLISVVADNAEIMKCANCFLNGAGEDGSCGQKETQEVQEDL